MLRLLATVSVCRPYLFSFLESKAGYCDHSTKSMRQLGHAVIPEQRFSTRIGPWINLGKLLSGTDDGTQAYPLLKRLPTRRWATTERWRAGVQIAV